MIGIGKTLALIALVVALVLTVGLLLAVGPYLGLLGLAALTLGLGLAFGAGLIGLFWLYAHARNTYLAGDTLVPDPELGNYPARLTRQGRVITIEPANKPQLARVTSYAPRFEYRGLPERVGPSVELPLPSTTERETVRAAATTVGPAPTWSHLLADGWRPTAERMLLGYTAEGPLWGSVEDLLSTAIAGRPKTGKTTLLRFIAAQTVLAGGQLVVLDPHGSVSDGGGLPAEWVATTRAELDDGAAWLVDELEKRLAEYRAGRRDFLPLMALVDEYPVVSLSSKDATAAAGRIILEARKTNFYGLISGQGLPASQFGGSLYRDALSSRYIFRTTAAQARIAGLDRDNARLVESLERGQAIFEGPINPTLVAIPNVTGTDLADLLSLRGRPSQPPGSTSTNPNPGSSPNNNNGRGSQTRVEVKVNVRARADAPPVFYYPTRAEPQYRGPVQVQTYQAIPGEDNPPSQTVTAQYRELPAGPTELEQVARLYRAGYRTVRALGAALNCGKDRAARLLNEARAAGLLLD